jgi:peptidoglycan/LPS O-acetylase OafA/YrhL
MTKQHEAEYFVAVDVLRGLAACAVLVVHYRHFLMEGPGRPVSDATLMEMPYQPGLSLVSEHGHYAVQLFWLISGFVFAAAYFHRNLTGMDFVAARIARLYPLHLLTLLLVAMLQFLSMSYTGGPQIYGNNSGLNFALQLFMASNWHGFTISSFNFPVWSVSMEIVIYTAFWCVLPFIRKRPQACVMAIIAIVAILDWTVRGTGQTLFQCALFFFSGSFCHQLLRTSQTAIGKTLICGAAFASGMVLDGEFSILFLSAAAVMSFSWINTGYALEAAKKLRWLGDSAYGIYLWHVPIQIAILLTLAALGVSKTIALEPWFFVIFIIMVVAIARLSFVYFERPAQFWIKKMLAQPTHVSAIAV